jgi:flagellar motor switch protein FliG
MGPVRLSDVEIAQQKIVDVVRRLEDAGEIIISGRGGEKELIV